jgi:hypothetical protein
MPDRTRLVGLYAIVASLAAVFVAPLLALSYVNTGEGSDELSSGPVSWWADPALAHLGDVVTWASAGRVYATYTQMIAVLPRRAPLRGSGTAAEEPPRRLRSAGDVRV